MYTYVNLWVGMCTFVPMPLDIRDPWTLGPPELESQAVVNTTWVLETESAVSTLQA